MGIVTGVIAKEVIGGIVDRALAKVKDSKHLPIETNAEVKAVKEVIVKEAAKEINSRVDHLNNTESHWFQKRSFWSAIVGLLTVVGGPILVRYGIELTDADREFWTQTLTTVGSVWAAYLAYRAGTAKKPLGE